MEKKLIAILEDWAQERRDRWMPRDGRKFSVWDRFETALPERIRIDFQDNAWNNGPGMSYKPDLIWVGCRMIAEVTESQVTFKYDINSKPYSIGVLDMAEPDFFDKIEYAFVETGLFTPQYKPNE